MPDLGSHIAMVREETDELREISEKRKADVSVLGGLQEEVLAVKKTVAEFLPIAEKTQDVRLDAEK